MKIRTSYFYKLREFTPNMIPVSTAMWDPKWFHDFKGTEYIFKDRHGVYNGIRYESFVPGLTCEGLCRGSERCGQTPDSCTFLQNYYKQLQSLDFNLVIQELEALALQIQKHEGFSEEPIIVLMVYEKPEMLCSERVMLKKWFNENNYNIEEV